MTTKPFAAFASALAALALPAALIVAPARAAAQTPSSPADSTARPQSRPAVVKHQVKRGDTLWDIAKFYLKDPFRWPEVFHANTDIVKNPHWIYPGQILTIEGAAVKDEVAAQVDDQGYVLAHIETQPETDDQATPTTAFITRRTPPPLKQAVLQKPPVFTVRRGEYDAAPFMVDARKPLGNGVIAGAADRLALGLKSDAGFQLNDRLYVTHPVGVTLAPGSLILLAHVGDQVTDVGQVIEPSGVLRVDSITDKGLAVGNIIRQFGPVSRTAVVLPFDRSFQETTVRPVPGAYPTAAKVVWIRHEPLLSSLQTYVMVDAPAKGVQPGDEFTLYDDSKQNDAGIATPPVATATVQIVRVTPYAVTGLIVTHEQPVVRTGMTARLTAKMP